MPTRTPYQGPVALSASRYASPMLTMRQNCMAASANSTIDHPNGAPIVDKMGTSGSEKITTVSNETIQGSNETVHESNETVHESNETVRESNETVQKPNETVQKPNETVQESRKSFQEPKEIIRSCNETIAVPNMTFDAFSLFARFRELENENSNLHAALNDAKLQLKDKELNEELNAQLQVKINELKHAETQLGLLNRAVQEFEDRAETNEDAVKHVKTLIQDLEKAIQINFLLEHDASIGKIAQELVIRMQNEYNERFTLVWQDARRVMIQTVSSLMEDDDEEFMSVWKNFASTYDEYKVMVLRAKRLESILDQRDEEINQLRAELNAAKISKVAQSTRNGSDEDSSKYWKDKYESLLSSFEN